MYKKPIILPRSNFLRPYKKIPSPKKLEIFFARLTAFPQLIWHSRINKYKAVLPIIHSQYDYFKSLSDTELRSAAINLGCDLRRNDFSARDVAITFALIREVSSRVLGFSHFDTQLLAGLAMLYGNIIEMETGEGKTLAATLPACAAALAGIPVHIVTVNDYLAKRDFDEMSLLFNTLGLSSGYVTHGMSTEQRRSAYACDIVYCTNKELVFDYLKDNINIKGNSDRLKLHAARLKGDFKSAEKGVLHGLHFAIIDEADSILLDEAVTPLVISSTPRKHSEADIVYSQALEISRRLIQDHHFKIDFLANSIVMLAESDKFIKESVKDLGSFWSGRIRRVELISKALTALYLFHRDQHYLVVDNKVQIVDAHTGRVMPDRSWEGGLQQLIELKEGCELTKARETLTKICFQRFFRQYYHIAGMTGTAREVRAELWNVYQMPVVKINTHCISLREIYPVKVCDNNDMQLSFILNSITKHVNLGRAVLVATSSVASSESLSRKLTSMHIDHQVLNARQDDQEAKIISQAGDSSAVTIATSMAGRGTDIKLSESVAAAGGLHVILTEFQDSKRIDRQIIGRSGRMGDPGSAQHIFSMDDNILSRLPQVMARCIPVLLFGFPDYLRLVVLRHAQRYQEKRNFEIRKQLMKADDQQEQLFSFTERTL